MRDHDRYGYEGFDEHEADGYDQEEGGDVYEEEEEEQEEEQAPKPTKEELEYLALRQRLKEAARQRMKKECGTSLSHSQEKEKKPPIDNFGSFFGPSQPVIARRVLEESQSIMETRHIQAKNLSSHSTTKKGPALAPAEMKSSFRHQPRKVVNEVKLKAQKLKDTRDYSFLLSDDAELPEPIKEPVARNASVPVSAQASLKNRPLSISNTSSAGKTSSMSKPARPVSAGHGERKSVSLGREERKCVSNGREERNSVYVNRQVQTKVAHPKVVSVNNPDRPSADPRKVLGSNAGNGPRQPAGPKGPLTKAPATTLDKKKIPAVGINGSVPSKHKVPLLKTQSVSQKQLAEQKREPQILEKPKLMPKQPVSSSKHQVKPPKHMPPRSMQDARPKKRPVQAYSDEDDDSEDAAAINMIRNMFRYNPSRYADIDDDDSDMEANFDDIQREERRSAKIAKEEDEREYRLNEEEERRERLRKKSKMHKISRR